MTWIKVIVKARSHMPFFSPFYQPIKWPVFQPVFWVAQQSMGMCKTGWNGFYTHSAHFSLTPYWIITGLKTGTGWKTACANGPLEEEMDRQKEMKGSKNYCQKTDILQIIKPSYFTFESLKCLYICFVKVCPEQVCPDVDVRMSGDSCPTRKPNKEPVW